MTPDVAVPFATFVLVLWLVSRLGASTKPSNVEVDPDVERAREFVRTKIEEHAEALAERYLEACEEDRRGDRAPGSFARDIDVALENPEIAPVVREVVILEREHVYELILSRVQAT